MTHNQDDLYKINLWYLIKWHLKVHVAPGYIGSSSWGSWWDAPLALPHAHLAPADACTLSSSLQRLWSRLSELSAWVNGREPEAELVSVVVASSTRSVTFNERWGSEVFQTRARTRKWLTTTFSTGWCMLYLQTLDKTIWYMPYLQTLDNAFWWCIYKL